MPVLRGRRGRDNILVGSTTTCAIREYHRKRCKVESPSY